MTGVQTCALPIWRSLGNGQGKDHQPHFSDEEKLRLRDRGVVSEVTGQSRHAAPALPHPARPGARRAVPCSWMTSWGLFSGCSSSSSSEDQALSVASVMANCSATPVGDGPGSAGARAEGVGGIRCQVRLAPDTASWGCPSMPGHADQIGRASCRERVSSPV